MTDLVFEDVTIHYGETRVVDSLSLRVPSGAIVGLVGESGCGKSTLARAAVGLQPLTEGSIRLGDVEVKRGSSAGLQMVFQDPYASLDPRMTIGQSIAEALPRKPRMSRAARRTEVGNLLAQVAIDPNRQDMLPAKLSGGQRQRVGIARALAARPTVIVADEITSALDASVQGTMLNLVRNLQRTLGLSMLFISHNMAVVRYVSDEIAVMREGKIIELGASEKVASSPEHPYTQSLIQAARMELVAADA